MTARLRARLQRWLHLIFIRDGRIHGRVTFASGTRFWLTSRFIGCSCGEQFFADDSDPVMGYEVRNFIRSWSIKRELRDR